MDEFLGRTLMDDRKWQGRAMDSQDNGPSDPFAFLKLFSCPCVNREACPDTQSKICVCRQKWRVWASRSAIRGLKNITNKVKKKNKSSRCTFLCGKGICLHVWYGHNKASYSHRKAVGSSGPQRTQIFGHSGLMCPGAIKHSLQRRWTLFISNPCHSYSSDLSQSQPWCMYYFPSQVFLMTSW